MPKVPQADPQRPAPPPLDPKFLAMAATIQLAEAKPRKDYPTFNPADKDAFESYREPFHKWAEGEGLKGRTYKRGTDEVEKQGDYFWTEDEGRMQLFEYLGRDSGGDWDFIKVPQNKTDLIS